MSTCTNAKTNILTDTPITLPLVCASMQGNNEDTTEIKVVTQNVVGSTSLPAEINLCGHSADCEKTVFGLSLVISMGKRFSCRMLAILGSPW